MTTSLILACAAILGPVLTYLAVRRTTALEREASRETVEAAAVQARAKLAHEAHAAEEHAALVLREELRKDLEHARGEILSLRSEVHTLRAEVLALRDRLILERETTSRLRLCVTEISALVDRCDHCEECPVRASGMLPTPEAEATARHRAQTPPHGLAVPDPPVPLKGTA